MQITLHQTHFPLGAIERRIDYLEAVIKKNISGIHLFPELFLCGYPPRDWQLHGEFQEQYLAGLERVRSLSKLVNEGYYFFGGLDAPTGHSNSSPTSRPFSRWFNCAFMLQKNHSLQIAAYKQLLPNYDVFEESRYYIPGPDRKMISIEGIQFIVLICEDLWSHLGYLKSPIEELESSGEKIDAILSLNASPWHRHKAIDRVNLCKKINKPIFYVNQVGAYDGVIFDGGSFSYNSPNGEFHYLPNFKADARTLSLNNFQSSEVENTSMLDAITFAIKEYASSNKLNSVVIGLSGGIDSAVVACIAKFAEIKNIYLYYLPSPYSSSNSLIWSQQLCQNLGINLVVKPISELISTFEQLVVDDESLKSSKNKKITLENLQSRIRAVILTAYANLHGAFVLNTSNRTEIAVGYSTQYGDSIGAISPLGDLSKSDVYQLAQLINQKGNLIPQEIIHRPPSAELSPQQTDEEQLAPYSILDSLVEDFFVQKMSQRELSQHYPADILNKILPLFKRSEFKRWQFSPIVKTRVTSFGVSHRYPISSAVFDE